MTAPATVIASYVLWRMSAWILVFAFVADVSIHGEPEKLCRLAEVERVEASWHATFWSPPRLHDLVLKMSSGEYVSLPTSGIDITTEELRRRLEALGLIVTDLEPRRIY